MVMEAQHPGQQVRSHEDPVQPVSTHEGKGLANAPEASGIDTTVKFLTPAEVAAAHAKLAVQEQLDKPAVSPQDTLAAIAAAPEPVITEPVPTEAEIAYAKQVVADMEGKVGKGNIRPDMSVDQAMKAVGWRDTPAVRADIAKGLGYLRNQEQARQTASAEADKAGVQAKEALSKRMQGDAEQFIKRTTAGAAPAEDLLKLVTMTTNESSTAESQAIAQESVNQLVVRLLLNEARASNPPIDMGQSAETPNVAVSALSAIVNREIQRISDDPNISMQQKADRLARMPEKVINGFREGMLGKTVKGYELRDGSWDSSHAVVLAREGEFAALLTGPEKNFAGAIDALAMNAHAEPRSNPIADNMDVIVARRDELDSPEVSSRYKKDLDDVMARKGYLWNIAEHKYARSV